MLDIEYFVHTLFPAMTLNYAFDFQIIFDSSSHGLLIPGVLAVLLAISFLVFYRLVLHPLARYPGPRLAAISIGYEFYYDAIKGGMYTFEIQRMHEKYGPIVRISPNELHTNEPSFIDELYAGGGKVRDKYDYATGQFGIPDSVFGAVSHNLHRMRRAALNPFFSKASVNKLEPIIFEAVNKLCRQLSTYESSGKAVDLTMAFSCLTTDIVTEYAFAKSSNFLDSPTFDTNFHKAIIIGSSMGVLTKPLPWILTALRALPECVGIAPLCLRGPLMIEKLVDDTSGPSDGFVHSMARSRYQFGFPRDHRALTLHQGHKKTSRRRTERITAWR